MFSHNIFLIVFVACVTGIGSKSIGMAGGTARFALPAMIKREDVVDQPGWLPASIRVTVLAPHPKVSGMDFWFLMTGGANCLRLIKNPTCMAIGTRQLDMLTRQRKNTAVIEILHAIHTVMAFQTIGAKRTSVFVHKGAVICGVAGIAGELRLVLNRCLMAVLACHRTAIIAALMDTQRESG